MIWFSITSCKGCLLEQSTGFKTKEASKTVAGTGALAFDIIWVPRTLEDIIEEQTLQKKPERFYNFALRKLKRLSHAFTRCFIVDQAKIWHGPCISPSSMTTGLRASMLASLHLVWRRCVFFTSPGARQIQGPRKIIWTRSQSFFNIRVFKITISTIFSCFPLVIVITIFPVSLLCEILYRLAIEGVFFNINMALCTSSDLSTSDSPSSFPCKKYLRGSRPIHGCHPIRSNSNCKRRLDSCKKIVIKERWRVMQV